MFGRLSLYSAQCCWSGNLVRQPALTRLAEDHKAQGLPAPYRVVGELANTDRVMTGSFWVGVYPGLTEAMRAYVAETLRAFVAERKARPTGLRVVAS